jgi:hypothetical protein
MNIKLPFIFLICSVFTFSCSEILEEELNNENVKLIAPADQHSFTEYSQTFWWSKVIGATQYHFQLVEGSFEQPLKVISDTNLVLDKFVLSLYPGSFQWRVKAFNSGYETSFSTRNFRIDSTSLELQKVIIKLPKNETFHSGVVNFSWEPLFGATNYILEVDNLTGNFSNPLFSDTLNTGSLSSFSIYRDTKLLKGKYQWRVKGGVSLFSDPEIFAISSVAPAPTTPFAGAINVSSPVSFTWAAEQGIASFSILIQDSTRVLIKKETALTQKSFSFDPTSLGTMKKFYWAVVAKDLSGISSDTSSFQYFSIK